MENPSSAVRKAEVQPRSIEPIFDASGALRRAPRETKQGSDETEKFQVSRTTSHPAR